ncbi:MAG: response regulator [Melioribacteraceae bacterium]|nr:response regulator [Melioribacteraceae bacterium]
MSENKFTVLLIEDDSMTLDIFSRVLNKEFNLLVTNDVNEFYKYCTDFIIDCFLIDLSLGLQKSGLTLIKELRASEKYYNTPIIVITAHAFARDERVCLEAGANKFLRKPVDHTRLIKEVKNTILKMNERKTFID